MYWLRLFVILSFLLICQAWLWRRKSSSSPASNRATRSSSRRPPIRSWTARRPRGPSIRRPSIRRSPRTACSSKVSCASCTSHRTWTGACRWCLVDGLCHAAGAIFTNPCRRSQNIVNKWNCNRTPKITVKPTTSKPITRRPTRTRCIIKTNCISCTSHKSWSGASCRWCPKDSKCHAHGAIFTNPCRRSQNIVNKFNCNRTPTTTLKPTASKPTTRRPAKARCITKTNCSSCTNHLSWSGFPCRWCPKDEKCHAHGAIFTNPCRRSQNIVNKFNCYRTPTTTLKPTTSKPTTRRPTRARCITKTNCSSCTNHLSWSGFPCRWCPVDGKCHAHGAVATNLCCRSQNIVKTESCPKPSSPPSYDQNLSYKMVFLSALAYADNVSIYISKAAEIDTFRVVKQVTKPCHSLKCPEHTNCSGFIAVSQKEKVIAIVFRGSQSICQAKRVHGKEVGISLLKGIVHQRQTYFQNSFQKVWNDLKRDVYSQINKHSSYKLWVTGYSLGGALASLASLHIAYERKTPKNNLILYTFGQPRTGDCQYAFAHNILVPISFRVVHYRDPVANLPPYSSLGTCRICGPYHHGREIFYNQRVMSKDSPYKTCNGPEDVACSNQFSNRTKCLIPLMNCESYFEDHNEYFGIDVQGWWKEK